MTGGSQRFKGHEVALNQLSNSGAFGQRHRIGLCVIAVFMLNYWSPVWAASFDCAKATTKHERHICADPVANAADTLLGAAYRSALEAFPIRGVVRDSEQSFLLSYANCDSEFEGSCVAMVMERVGVLQSMHTRMIYGDFDSQHEFIPDDIILWLFVHDETATLHFFGGFMPDGIRHLPFPEGFVCDDSIPLKTTPTGWESVPPADTVSVTGSSLTADITCSPRNGIHGKIRRVQLSPR